jgi:hypothetical protein
LASRSLDPSHRLSRCLPEGLNRTLAAAGARPGCQQVAGTGAAARQLGSDLVQVLCFFFLFMIYHYFYRFHIQLFSSFSLFVMVNQRTKITEIMKIMQEFFNGTFATFHPNCYVPHTRLISLQIS